MSGTATDQDDEGKYRIINEGKASIRFLNKNEVFYNPAQVFNRDLSCNIISEFLCSTYKPKREVLGRMTVLEALSATGLRAVRYAKEVEAPEGSEGLSIVANDMVKEAADLIQTNIEKNGVQDSVRSSHANAISLMYGAADSQNWEDRFDVVDLDPYGSPHPFLDSAFQCVHNGGLMAVTATDLAVLGGAYPETCYAKYGATSIRGKNTHEFAVRILLQSLNTAAARHGKYIEPLVSLSIDFYIRVFVRVYTGKKQVKESIVRLSNVARCKGCESLREMPLGEWHNGKEGSRAVPASLTFDPSSCNVCGSQSRQYGPVWNRPIHDVEFVRRVIARINRVEEEAKKRVEEADTTGDAKNKKGIKTYSSFATAQRMIGFLSVAAEELPDIPFYYTIPGVSAVMRVSAPGLTLFRSALLNAGYRVSGSHANRDALKTDAPPEFVFLVMAEWLKKEYPDNHKARENEVSARILDRVNELKAAGMVKDVDFTEHPQGPPPLRQQGLVRFPELPANWGPLNKAKVTQQSSFGVDVGGSSEQVQVNGKQSRLNNTHPKRKDRRPLEKTRRLPCRAYAFGNCEEPEDQCRYSHDPQMIEKVRQEAEERKAKRQKRE
eukprot:Clim_evm48s214 gene=Clim_evmTU48s214